MQSKWLRLTRTKGDKNTEMIAINFAWIANVEPTTLVGAGARLVYHDDSVVLVMESAASIMAALNAASLA